MELVPDPLLLFYDYRVKAYLGTTLININLLGCMRVIVYITKMSQQNKLAFHDISWPCRGKCRRWDMVPIKNSQSACQLDPSKPEFVSCPKRSTPLVHWAKGSQWRLLCRSARKHAMQIRSTERTRIADAKGEEPWQGL